MNNISIEVKNLSKLYKIYNEPMDRLKEALSIKKKKMHKDYYSLNDISFTIRKGETVGIVGENGAGKSTLLKIITGVLTPSNGSVVVNGNVAALLELGAGFNHEYTGIENIYTQGALMGYSEEEMKKKVQGIIEFADIGDFIHQPVKIYSSGMFARLAFATAISVEPDILIVDEALAVGDVAFQKKCIDKMKEIRNNGTTILFVSHALEQVKRFCTKAIWLSNGSIKKIGNVNKTVDAFSNWLSSGEINIKNNVLKTPSVINNDFVEIVAFELNSNYFETGQYFECTVMYRVSKKINDLLLGVAIYKNSGEYVFGPNTALDNYVIPNDIGEHQIVYRIPKLMLLSGEYFLDVGLFTDHGLVCFAYINGVENFEVQSNYISEGLVLLDHDWEAL